MCAYVCICTNRFIIYHNHTNVVGINCELIDKFLLSCGYKIMNNLSDHNLSTFFCSIVPKTI